MDHFDYRNGVLHAEDVAVPDIAAAVGTPFYCYSTATLERHYKVFDDAFEGLDHSVCYSVKANSNQAVIATLARLGAGADVVSEGELRRALAAGIPADRIVFSGVGKTRDELAFALDTHIRLFNVESEAELAALNALAVEREVKAPVAMRINPDIDAGTHPHISTGLAESKFGIPSSRVREVYQRAGEMAGIEVVGVDVHIGSQLTELEPFEAAFGRIAELVPLLRADGHSIHCLDLGGGLGVPYSDRGDNEDADPPLPLEYGKLVRRVLGNLGCEIVLEPGRLIAGNAGILVAQIVYVKEGEDRSFLILDAAMNDLIRPALYEAHHRIEPVIEKSADDGTIEVDIVGPVCETTDSFARNRSMPPLAEGELVAILTAGAYGAVQASAYNTRPLVPEVMVKGDQFAIIRNRPGYEEILAQDSLPGWLGS